MHIEIEKERKEISEDYGLHVSMLVQESMNYLTAN